MKKVYKLEDLDCANCASKMEQAINNIDGVNIATVNFMASKLTLDLTDIDEDKLNSIIKQIQKVIRKIEPDCRVVI
jgi:copper chaperone CopZ